MKASRPSEPHSFYDPPPCRYHDLPVYCCPLSLLCRAPWQIHDRPRAVMAVLPPLLPFRGRSFEPQLSFLVPGPLGCGPSFPSSPLGSFLLGVTLPSEVGDGLACASRHDRASIILSFSSIPFWRFQPRSINPKLGMFPPYTDSPGILIGEVRSSPLRTVSRRGEHPNPKP